MEKKPADNNTQGSDKKPFSINKQTVESLRARTSVKCGAGTEGNSQPPG